MIDEYDYIDLIDSSTTSSVVFPECSIIGVSHHGGVGWCLYQDRFSVLLLYIYLIGAHFYILYVFFVVRFFI